MNMDGLRFCEAREERMMNPEVVRGSGAEENCMADCCVLYGTGLCRRSKQKQVEMFQVSFSFFAGKREARSK
jgi:hypothetical protein